MGSAGGLNPSLSGALTPGSLPGPCSSPLHRPHPTGPPSPVRKQRNSGCDRELGSRARPRVTHVSASYTHVSQRVRFPTSGASLGSHLAAGLEGTSLEKQKEGTLEYFNAPGQINSQDLLQGLSGQKQKQLPVWATWLEPCQACRESQVFHP